LKALLKKWVKLIPIAFTKNQQYDRLTRRIIQRVCRIDSNCLDVGCHKGEILALFLHHAPQGRHHAFEPIPHLYKHLLQNFQSPNCHIHEVALSDKKGTTSFNYVISNPSYSGLIKRSYDRPKEEDTLITVETDTLDTLLPENYRVDFIKIDVEGGELQVLRGAVRLLKKWKPVIIFEHGLGASDAYGSTPEQLFDLLSHCDLAVNTLSGYVRNTTPMNQDQFSTCFYQRQHYYFAAYPPIHAQP
jgi:FkbM family methyltransferase